MKPWVQTWVPLQKKKKKLKSNWRLYKLLVGSKDWFEAIIRDISVS
jgi:hypothetical protein